MSVQIGAPTLSGVDLTVSEALSQWSHKKQAEQAQQSLKRARQAGQEADIPVVDGVRQKPQDKQKRLIGSKTVEQYNAGLRDAYLLSIDRDNTQEISRIAQESKGNLQKFDTVMDQYRSTVLGNVDPASQGSVKLTMDRISDRARLQVQSQEIRRQQANAASQREEAFNAYGDEALRLVRNGDLEGTQENLLKSQVAIDSMVQSGDITSSQGEALLIDQQKGVFTQGHKREILDVAETSIEEARQSLDKLSKKVPSNFTPDEWDSFISNTQTDINRKEARQKSDAKIATEAFKESQSIQRGFLFTNPEIPADPAKSSQDRKDVNSYYDSVSPEWDGNLNQLINQNVDFVKNTGIVPDKLISNMNASMRSGGTGHVVAMMEVMQRIQETSPQSLKDFPSESQAVSLQVSDSMRNGLTQEEAIEAARKNTFGMSETQKAEIRIAASEKKGKEQRIKTFESMVSKEFDPLQFPIIGLFKNEPDIPVGMQASYMSNFEDMMSITNGNIEQSEKLAFEATKKVWGVSSTGGPRRFMQYPPESFYHVDGFDDGWIEDQFLEEMEGLGVEGGIIGIDSNVPRSAKPSYPVMAPNERGILDVVKSESGKPLRYQPDISVTPEYMDLVDSPNKAVETAEQRRKAKTERRASIMRRSLMADIFTNDRSSEDIPKSERMAFLGTAEGKEKVRLKVNNMLARRKVDAVEAKEVLEAFSAGSLADLPAFDILVKEGLIRAPD